MTTTETLTIAVAGEDNGATATLGAVATAATATDGAVEQLDRGLADLDRQTEDTTRELRRLRDEISRTGASSGLINDLRRTERQLRDIEERRRLLGRTATPAADPDPDPTPAAPGGNLFMRALRDGRASRTSVRQLGTDLGNDLATGLGGTLGKHPYLIAGAAAAFMAAAPLIGGTVAGAVTAGLASGAVVAGVALAVRDPRIKQIGAELGETVMDGLTGAAMPFQVETVRAIQAVEAAFGRSMPNVERMFTAASRYVVPLTNGVAGLAERALPGIVRAIERAGPVVDMLAEELPELGEDIGTMFGLMAEHSEEAALALRIVLDLLGGTVKGFGLAINVMTAAMGPALVLFNLFNRESRMMVRAGEDGDPAMRALAEATGVFGDEAEKAAADAKSLHDELTEIVDINISLFSAQNAAVIAQKEVTEAIRENNKEIKDSRQRTAENNRELINFAQTLNQVQEATNKSTTNTRDQTAVYERQRQAFINAAIAAGRTSAEAENLANQLLKLPTHVPIDIEADTRAARSNIGGVKALLASIQRNIVVRVDVLTRRDRDAQGGLAGLSEGGPVRNDGPKGVDRHPYLLASGEHVLSADDVDALGGHGNVSAMRRALRAGQSWGMSGGRAAGPRGGRAVNALRVSFAPGGDPLLDALWPFLQDKIRIEYGGVVQDALGSTS